MSTEHEVVLINMPFGNLLMPSIGLGLLKGALAKGAIPAKVLNFQLRFATMIGERDYIKIHDRTRTEHLAGEFIFSESLFGVRSDEFVQDFVNNILLSHSEGSTNDMAYSKEFVKELPRMVLNAREKVESFLEECLGVVLSCQPKLVGFTSLFQQHVASLSLAKRIKANLPHTFIILGGSNCEGLMGKETLRQFDFVDAVVSGEGELVFPEIVRRVLNSQPIPSLDGVFHRHSSELPLAHQRLRNTAIIENLDALPLPDYDEFFEQFNNSSINLPIKPSLLFETSRGCWWGEKQHCTFCGLNGENMVYRSKSASRAFSEFLYLTEKYPVTSINAVDNILDTNYFKEFLPLLAERKHGFKLFYEVKANLRKEHVQLLGEAGVGRIQPGIESLSDDVLRLMRKGVTALQNIQLLKWCREFGVGVYYNLIWGFPGEQPNDYSEMSKLIPLITHLSPPIGDGRIRIDRFSPNFEEAEQRGFSKLSPHGAYQYVYPFGIDVLGKLAYFFTPEIDTPCNVAEYTGDFAEEIKRWRSCHPKSDLFWIQKDQRLLVWDFRPVAQEVLTVLKESEVAAYLACDQIRTPRQVLTFCRTHETPTSLSEAQIRYTLDSLTERLLMLRHGDSYLALAYPKSNQVASADTPKLSLNPNVSFGESPEGG
jgi:ribosomal peptide maturation radical SAM protein 1